MPPGPREKRHLRDLVCPLYHDALDRAHIGLASFSQLLAQVLGHAHLGSVPDGRYKAYT